MARLDEYLFGYRFGQVDTADTAKLASALLRLGASSTLYPCGKFSIKEKDTARFQKSVGGRIRYQLGDVRGARGFLLRCKDRYGFFIALLMLLLVFLFTRTLIWDVRIEGNETLTRDEVMGALEDVGFTTGTSWNKIDKSFVEASLLASHPEIAWISLNRRGTVAYVELIESENVGEEKEIYPLCSNIVADRDGVIEDITVKSGQAVVKVGDVVRAGDVLISGVIESESGLILCRAEGEVRARSATDISAIAERFVTEKESISRRLLHARILLFNFSINIFKNYGNRENSCDIIEEIRSFALFDKYRLPIRLEISRSVEYEETVLTRSESEMIEAARRELDGKIYSMFKDADVIGLGTSGEFKDDVFYLRSRVVYSTDIGKESAIEIN